MEPLDKKEFFIGKGKMASAFGNCITKFPDYTTSPYPILYKDDLINCYRIAMASHLRIPNVIGFWEHLEALLSVYDTFSVFLSSVHGQRADKRFKYVVQYAYAAKDYNPRDIYVLSKADEVYLNKLLLKYKPIDNGLD
jgi:hypothetical protein